MANWIIKDENGTVINRIVASEDFVSENFEFYEEENPIDLEAQAILSARFWRDSELKETDAISIVTDHPKHTEILEYRQALRDWPASENFPNSDRPVNPLN